MLSCPPLTAGVIEGSTCAAITASVMGMQTSGAEGTCRMMDYCNFTFLVATTCLIL